MNSGSPSTQKRVAVIGAGAAGLCAAKHLLANHHEVVVFEMGSQVGGLWVYQNDNGISPAYRSLHLNSEARVTAYQDFPFPEGTPLYPDHWQVHNYLKAYADQFKLLPLIRFNAKVEKLEAQGDGWTITVQGQSPEYFDSVVIGTGHQGKPMHPEWRQDFKGTYLHAHNYRVPEPFRDQRVLVVGMGNSAVDIASDICTVTQSTVISARSPVLVMPRVLFGVPISRVLAKIEKPWMPWPVRRTIREFLTRIVHGTMEQWGFVTPKSRTHPTSHPSLMAHFVWNRVRAKPGIQAVQGQTVTFADGSQENFDCVIAGTGYEVDLPFLNSKLAPLHKGQLNLFLRVVHPEQKNLFFAGMFNVAGGGNIRMMDDQAEWIADIVSGKHPLPSRSKMQKAMDQELAFLRQHYPASARYALELDPTFYRRQLKRERQRVAQQ